MENATKALLIAAAVLIAIILTAIAVKTLKPALSTQDAASVIGKEISDSTQSATYNIQYSLGGLSNGKREEELSDARGEEVENNERYGNATEDEEELIKPIEYTVGDEIVIKNEHFFVIRVEDEKVILIAKYNLNINGTRQTNEGIDKTGVKFSDEVYWSKSDSIDIIDVEGYTEKDAMGKAQKYANLLGAERGRLLTYDEARKLEKNFPDILYGTNIEQTNNYLFYWLGSYWNSNWSIMPNDYTNIHIIDGNAKYITEGSCSDNYMGVRPVIEISKN